MPAGGSDNMSDRTHDRGMKGAVQSSQAGIHAIAGQRILCQVIGANTEEIDFFSHHIHQKRSRGRFYHDAQAYLLPHRDT